MITIKRIYDPVNPEDGYRVLVDRLWPRGMSKARAALHEWNKMIAPSTTLRIWYNHQPERFELFKEKYKLELKPHLDELKRLKALSEKQPITLLYSAKDTQRNQAIVLAELLQNL